MPIDPQHAACGDDRSHPPHTWHGIAKLDIGTKYGEAWNCLGIPASSAAPSTERASLFSLRDLQEAVALAVNGDWENTRNAVPQEVWDDLHRRGFVNTGQDITGDAETYTTGAGQIYLEGAIRG
jgi:hypothetical protein